ncbi:hypothetical protein BDZ97DRAFT_1767573 [Flammula alnicola]|nr:hypothetical protein BDZ97DRAFT_1767573 [Flammula alnicola]
MSYLHRIGHWLSKIRARDFIKTSEMNGDAPTVRKLHENKGLPVQAISCTANKFQEALAAHTLSGDDYLTSCTNCTVPASDFYAKQPSQSFFLHVLAMETDHVNDQKKLKDLFHEAKRFYDHEVQGENVLASVSPKELIFMIFEVNEKKIRDTGS